MPDIDSNLTKVEAFEEAGKEIFGEYGCLPMIAFGTTRTLSAFKLLARARNLDFETQNEISKQISHYEQDVKHAKENNQDDPDYNVDDEIQIDSYVDVQYLDLIEESRKYLGIITSVSPHPCGHIVYHKDLRREIGVIRVKSKNGNKEAVYAAYIDGVFADKFGWCKSDMLRVDVVKIISDTFKEIGQPVLTADELVAKTKNDPNVWNILANGYTMGCNQTERAKTTQRVMQFKPKNTVELSAFIAAIRPGAKSLVDCFVSRSPHTYGIPAMDKLLKLDGATGTTGESSFLFYDEQIMVLAEAAGIPAENTNALIKHIKKKHHKEVEEFKDQFVPGFVKYLTEKEHVKAELATKTATDVWTVILDSASYLFNLSHAYAMNLDCLYGMYLKAYYPYEFYKTLLKLYDEKKNVDKISSIITEMRRYKGISLVTGKWRQDNRTWTVDKEHSRISQSLSSIKSLNKEAAESLYLLGQQEEAVMGTKTIPAVMKPDIKKELNALKKQWKNLEKEYKEEPDPMMSEEEMEEYRNRQQEIQQEGTELETKIRQITNNPDSYESPETTIPITAKLDCFINVIRAIQMNTKVKTNQLLTLIKLGYFSEFGKTGKLVKLYNEFFDGKYKLDNKNLKSFEERLEILREMEKTMPDEDLPIDEQLSVEMDSVGLCLTVDPTAPANRYYVESVDSTYGVKVNMYSVQRGTTGMIRISKKDFERVPVSAGSLFTLVEHKMRPRCAYKNGERVPIPGENECWVTRYTIQPRQKPAAQKAG